MFVINDATVDDHALSITLCRNNDGGLACLIGRAGFIAWSGLIRLLMLPRRCGDHRQTLLVRLATTDQLIMTVANFYLNCAKIVTGAEHVGPHR